MGNADRGLVNHYGKLTTRFLKIGEQTAILIFFSFALLLIHASNIDFVLAGGSESLYSFYRVPFLLQIVALGGFCLVIFCTLFRRSLVRYSSLFRAPILAGLLCSSSLIFLLSLNSIGVSDRSVQQYLASFRISEFEFSTEAGFSAEKKSDFLILKEGNLKKGYLFLGLGPLSLDGDSLQSHPLLNADKRL